MSFDFQMARGHNENCYNLAVGEPFFLQDQIDHIPVEYTGALTYPLTDGQPQLLKILQDMYPDKYIVITNGAKGGLLAAFYAYREVYMRGSVSHDPPYWPSYPTLAKLTDLSFNSGYRPIKVITSPNNPDCEEYNGKCDIWDAAYANDSVYGKVIPPEHEVAVYSSSKFFGLSGLRIGWVVTSNEALAKAMSQFMEITTSGVSVVSQLHLAKVLYQHLCGNLKVDMALAHGTILANVRAFNQYAASFCDTILGTPKTNKGMFAWFKVNDQLKFEDALTKDRIKLVTGEACGMTDPGWYRMNLGHRTDTINKVCSHIQYKFR